MRFPLLMSPLNWIIVPLIILFVYFAGTVVVSHAKTTYNDLKGN